MKKFLTTVAFLSIIASPAFSQYNNGDEGAGSRIYRQAPNYDGVYRNRASNRNGHEAYAYEPAPYSYDPYRPSCAGDLGYGRLDYSSC
jgi:hypothetical protein